MPRAMTEARRESELRRREIADGVFRGILRAFFWIVLFPTLCVIGLIALGYYVQLMKAL